MTTTKLIWTSKKEWGTSGLTHKAEVGGWVFKAHQSAQPRPWILCVWGPGGVSLQRSALSLAGAKTIAESITKTHVR